MKQRRLETDIVKAFDVHALDFCVLVTDTNQQVCIINCDAPASKTSGLSADGRMRYFKTSTTCLERIP